MRVLSSPEVAFLVEGYKYFTCNDLTIEFNRYFRRSLNPLQIKSALKYHRKKLGLKPKCYRAVGAEIKDVRRNGRNRGVKIKIIDPHTGKSAWVSKHRNVWERENGRPVPKDHFIRFLDGDPFNCAPENLMCVSGSVHRQLNFIGYSNGLPQVSCTPSLGSIMKPEVVNDNKKKVQPRI